MGLRQIYEEMENEYLEKLEKYGNGYVVDENGEFEEYFDTLEDARNYAIKHNIKEIKALSFGYCYGAYCDGEYKEYNPALFDLDGNIIKWLED